MNKLLLALVSVAHFVPHPFGVSPIGAIALYAGATGPRLTAWLVPLAPLFVGHLITGFFNPVVMLFVYCGFALGAIIGRLLLSGQRSRQRYASAVIAQAFVFFLLSNFSIWLVGMYPATPAGLAQCYVNGLPYLGLAILVDAAYCFVLFGLHALLERDRSRPVTA